MPRATRGALQGWLRRQARPARMPLAVAVASGAVGSLFVIAQAWLLARVVVAVAVDGAGLDQAYPWLLALGGAAVGRAAATALGDAVAFEAGARLVLKVRADLQAHIVALGPAWTRRQRTGEVANTVFDAVESIGRYYSGYLPQTALVAFVPLAILAVVIPTDWVSGLIMVISAPLIPLFMVLIGKGTEALNQSQWRKLARMSGHLFDAIEGLPTLKLFNASRAEIAAVRRVSDDYRQATMGVLRVAFLSSLALEFLATVSIAMVAVYIGLRLYYREMDFLPGLAVLLLAPEFYRSLRSLGAQYHLRMEAIGASQSIVALLGTPLPPAPAGDAALPPGPIRTVRFERVGFGYDGAPVLEGIDLLLERGRCVALVGPSGAGKTTLGQLALGLLAPSGGRVLADRIDLAELPPDAWRRRVAWLPQRPTLFRGSIGDNIRLGQPDADLAAVRRAVERAGATALIAHLPDGYDTVVGDGGQGLSGGEIQRIGLARVFLKAADLVVFDEPGAGLDADTAALVTASIQALSAQAAVLVITHRLDAVGFADEVVVLERGRVVERGLPGDLRRRSAAYARLVGAAQDVLA